MTTRRAIRWAGLAVVVVVVAGSALIPAARADDEKVSGDLKKMQGVWVRAGDDGPEVRWVINGDTLKATVNGSEYVCALSLDPKAAPHPSADLTIKEGAGDVVGKTAKAIYKIDGDRLVFCTAHPGAEARPTEFKPQEDAVVLFELKKEK
jgi:uncharacterized protein (TIGR03067 family)